mgnify:CR=1 FL=1
MNQHQRTALAATESKAAEFARMHDAEVDKALMRRQDDKADTHRQAATFLREAVPALVKSVAELDDACGRFATEQHTLRDNLDELKRREDETRARLEKLLGKAKTNLGFLRRGGQNPANMTAVKIVEELHAALLQARKALEKK